MTRGGTVTNAPFPDLVLSTHNANCGQGVARAAGTLVLWPDARQAGYFTTYEGNFMRVVVALGGNALLRRVQPMIVENQRENIRVACDRLAPIGEQHELIICAVP